VELETGSELQSVNVLTVIYCDFVDSTSLSLFLYYFFLNLCLKKNLELEKLFGLLIIICRQLTLTVVDKI